MWNIKDTTQKKILFLKYDPYLKHKDYEFLTFLYDINKRSIFIYWLIVDELYDLNLPTFLISLSWCILFVFQSECFSVTIHSHGSIVAVGDEHGDVTFLNMEDGLHVTTLPVTNSPLYTLKYSPGKLWDCT